MRGIPACADRIAHLFEFSGWNMFSIEGLMIQHGCDWKQNIASMGDTLCYYDTSVYRSKNASHRPYTQQIHTKPGNPKTIAQGEIVVDLASAFDIFQQRVSQIIRRQR
jgi:hypothetical protein